MSTLKDLENKFQNYLLHHDLKIKDDIVSTNKVPADVRLKIYSEAYQTRLYEAMRKSYPALKTYLGDDAFENLCYEYIDQHPSEFRSIRWLGERLNTLLNDKKKLYLSELASLEWALELAFDAADAPLVSIEQINAISPEQWASMTLEFHPSVSRLSFSWNVTLLWKNLIEQKTKIIPEKITTEVLVWRENLMAQFSSLSPEEAWAIDMAMKGANFGEICEGLCQWVTEEEAGLRAASLLKDWMMAELISV